MIEICMYCGAERAGKFTCCEEVHFEQVTEEEKKWLDETGADIGELYTRREQAEKLEGKR